MRLRDITEEKVSVTVIPTTLLQDYPHLSLAARLLWCYLMSRPVDWRANWKDVRERVGIGRDGFRRAAEELLAAGWLERQREHGSDGRFLASQWVLKVPSPRPENQGVAHTCMNKGRNGHGIAGTLENKGSAPRPEKPGPVFQAAYKEKKKDLTTRARARGNGKTLAARVRQHMVGCPHADFAQVAVDSALQHGHSEGELAEILGNHRNAAELLEDFQERRARREGA